jgi:hypothetical protein
MALELVLTGTRETLAANDKALAASDVALAVKDQLLVANEVVSSTLIMLKTKELASFKAQFEPRIMLDIIYDAIKSSGAFADGRTKGKWGTLLDGVVTTDDKNNPILTPAAMRDLADLNATMELPTVVRDLDVNSISNRLSSAHHKGASDCAGTGWRLGGQSSPSLATALIVSVNLRKLGKREIDLPLKGRVAFLDSRTDVSHELDFDILRWTKFPAQGKGGA